MSIQGKVAKHSFALEAGSMIMSSIKSILFEAADLSKKKRSVSSRCPYKVEPYTNSIINNTQDRCCVNMLCDKNRNQIHRCKQVESAKGLFLNRTPFAITTLPHKRSPAGRSEVKN